MWSGRDEQTCLSWLPFSWGGNPLGAAPLLCLKVTVDGKGDDADLPELRSIELGYESCMFKEEDESTELVMRSDRSIGR